MRKPIIPITALLLLAALTTSCNRTGCQCYVKSDIAHTHAIFEDDNMSEEDCMAKEAELNDEVSMDVYRCR
ncbi:MAG: hypothetical protein IKU03_00500 [Bacteroidales bacterium]|nr:hypothetical protein [Bacteroidales bacterium]